MVKINIEGELAENKIVLLLIPSLEYNPLVLDNVKRLSKKMTGYITLNKTFDSLSELFKKNKVDLGNVVFIDAISKTLKNVPDQTKGCYFIDSPNSFTDMSLQINTFLRHDFSYIIFDSLTNLLIYQKKEPVAKFLSTIINKIRDSNTSAVFYCLDIKAHEELIEEASMFVDKVINLGSK